MPPGLEHLVDVAPCSCLPIIFRVCPECGDESAQLSTCWLCDGSGLLRPEPEDSGPFIIIHRCAAHPEVHA